MKKGKLKNSLNLLRVTRLRLDAGENLEDLSLDQCSMRRQDLCADVKGRLQKQEQRIKQPINLTDGKLSKGVETSRKSRKGRTRGKRKKVVSGPGKTSSESKVGLTITGRVSIAS